MNTYPPKQAGLVSRLGFIPLVALAIFSSSFASALTHEVIGHGITSIILGYNFYAFYASPVGVSEAYIDLREAADWEQGLVNAGGIVSDILLGILILLLSEKQKRFTPRFLLFFWSFNSLIGGSSYLTLSSTASFISGSTSGDPYWISYYFDIPLPILAFSGLAMCMLFYYILFKKLATLMMDRIMYVNIDDVLISISAIWILGLLPNYVISSILEDELGSKLLSVIFNSVSIFIMGHIAAARLEARPSSPPIPIERRHFAALAFVAIVTAATWLGVFGPTSKEAHGIILDELPNYVNLRITIWGNLTADVQLAFRPGPFENAWPRIKGSNPRWEPYLEEAESIVSGMFRTKDLQLLGYFTDNENFWYSGSWHSGGARSVFLRIPKVQTDRTIRNEMVLVLYDPWKPEGFIDSMNITLSGIHLVSSTPKARIAYSEITESVAWLNNSTDTSPVEYSLILVG